MQNWIHASHTKRVKTINEEVLIKATDSPSHARVCYVDPEGENKEFKKKNNNNNRKIKNKMFKLSKFEL